MTTAYTSLLGLALPVTGELQGTWGDTVNNYITSYLDAAVAGTQTLSTDADVTLTKTTNASLSSTSSQYSILLFSGARTAQRTVTVPAASKIYTVINKTTGGYAVKVVGSGPTTGITIANGESAVIAWNGSDFIKISNTAGAGVFTSITNTGLTSGRVVYSTTGGLETDSANLTFDGTSLTLGGNPTLSAGTANGVLYLNASKVATSGSALTFDGTDLATTGAVRLNNAQYYYGKNAAGSAVRLLGINAGNVNYVGAIDSGPTEVNYGSASSVIAQYWNISGSEQMRLTSTGLGIGTSSPGEKLDVAGNVNTTLASSVGKIVLRNSSTTSAELHIRPNSGKNGWLSFTEDSVADRWIVGIKNGNGSLFFNTGSVGTNTDRMVLDSSGNLGIGTSSPVSALNVSGTTAITWASGGTSSGLVTVGTQGTGGSLFVNTPSVNSSYASGFVADGTYDSGTGKSLIRLHALGTKSGGPYHSDMAFFTSIGITEYERMRLDNAGNLGLGVTPSAWSVGKAFEAGYAGNAFWGNSSDECIVTQAAYYNAGWKYARNGAATQYSQYNGAHRWYTAPSGTAGNAITFTQAMTLDASGNLGIGTTSPSSKLHIKSTTGTAETLITLQTAWSSPSGNKSILWTDSSGTLGAIAVNYSSPQASMTFGSLYNSGYNSTDLMTLTPTGLGIGTSSPTAKLTAVGTVKSASATQSAFYLSNAAQTNGFLLGRSLGSDDAQNFFIYDTVAAATRLYLDSSGNLGLGVTPQTWFSGYKVFQFGDVGALSRSSSGAVILSNNDYASAAGTETYLTTGYSTRYYQYQGQHVWQTAASGTAGTAISFTQAMTLDASGRLGIGETSPSYSIDVKAPSSGDTTIRLTKSGSINTTINAVSGAMTFGVDASGGTTERARITSGGDLLVGTTSNNPAGTVAQFVNQWSGGSKWGASFDQTVSSATSYTHINFSTNGTTVGSIGANNTTTAYNTTSDPRLKTLVSAVTGAGERIDALQPVVFDWKSTGKRARGFFADKFQEVYPDSVTGEKDAVDAEGNPVYQQMQASTAEVIADLVAELQSLRKRVAQLEGK